MEHPINRLLLLLTPLRRQDDNEDEILSNTKKCTCVNQLHFGTDFSKNVLVPVASPYLPFPFKIAWSRASQKDVLSYPRPAAESGLFFILGQFICTNVWANILYKGKET